MLIQNLEFLCISMANRILRVILKAFFFDAKYQTVLDISLRPKCIKFEVGLDHFTIKDVECFHLGYHALKLDYK